MEAISNLRKETQHWDTNIKQLIKELGVEDDEPHTEPVILHQGEQISKASLSVLVEDLMIGTKAFQKESRLLARESANVLG